LPRFFGCGFHETGGEQNQENKPTEARFIVGIHGYDVNELSLREWEVSNVLPAGVEKDKELDFIALDYLTYCMA
jgi:hypothetical protein